MLAAAVTFFTVSAGSVMPSGTAGTSTHPELPVLKKTFQFY